MLVTVAPLDGRGNRERRLRFGRSRLPRWRVGQRRKVPVQPQRAVDRPGIG